MSQELTLPTQAALSFISIGCNKVANCAHWGTNGIVAYGAGNFVALYDVEVDFSKLDQKKAIKLKNNILTLKEWKNYGNIKRT